MRTSGRNFTARSKRDQVLFVLFSGVQCFSPCTVWGGYEGTTST